MGGRLCAAMLLLAAAACARPAPLPEPPRPAVAPAPRSDSTPPTWASARVPSRRARYILRWHLQTRSGETRGRATVAVVPPDSLRFEYRAPFGRHGTALIVGGKIARAEPEKDVERLIEVVPLLWAALGIPWHRTGVGEVGSRPRGDGTAWRVAWSDTVMTYARWTGSPASMTAQLLVRKRVVGTAYVAFSDEDGRPTAGHVRFSATRSVLSFTIESVEGDSTRLPRADPWTSLSPDDVLPPGAIP